jgi:antitoxin HicB
VLEPEEEGGFTVRVPSFAEIVTYDANEHEALEMAKDAIRLVLEGSAARGEAMRLSVTPTCCSISGIAVASVWPSYGLPGSALTWATNWPPFECLRALPHSPSRRTHRGGEPCPYRVRLPEHAGCRSCDPAVAGAARVPGAPASAPRQRSSPRQRRD